MRFVPAWTAPAENEKAGRVWPARLWQGNYGYIIQVKSPTTSDTCMSQVVPSITPTP